MRKVLLVAAMLLSAAPVMAVTTITAVQEGNYLRDGVSQVIVRIDYATDVNIRAFALDINVDGGMTLDRIRDFNTGESVAPKKGYGIFPSRFRDFIVVTGPNWADTNYNPTVAWNEPGSAGTGLDTNKIIVEMGTLYAGEANRPALSGTLFRFDVNSEGGIGPATMTIAANTLRGGVVGEDGNAVTTNLPITLNISSCMEIPCIVGMCDPLVYDLLIIEAGLVKKTLTSRYSDTVPAGCIISQDPPCGVCVPTGSDVNLVYSLGRFPTPSQLIYPMYDPDCNLPIYWAAVAGATGFQLDRSANSGSTWTNFYDGNGIATFKTDTVAVGPNYRYRVRAKNADSNSLYNTGTFDCNAILSTCYRDFNTADPNWSQWRAMGRPDCWCKFKAAGLGPRGGGYQCDGDADQLASSPPDSFRVYTADLALLQANWKKKLSAITMDPNFTGTLKVTSACADFDHKASSPPDSFRVYVNDLNILVSHWAWQGSSGTNPSRRLPGNCPR